MRLRRGLLLLPAAAVAITSSPASAAGHDTARPAAGLADAARPTAVIVRTAPPVPVLKWRPCDSGFQCATARVPLDYRHEHGAAVSLAVVRHLATGPARVRGSLFINFGGQEQITPFLATYAFLPAVVRARFNIIAFDPRGFGYSTAVRCFPTTAAEHRFLTKLPPFPVGARQDAAWVRAYARYDALCAQRNQALLAHDTTADDARDLNLLRQAVGAPVLNYLGISYGTGLGAVYANLFPARTGRIILDGNLGPVAWTSGGRLSGSLRMGADQASAAVMRDFLDLCGNVTTSRCAFSAGTPAATRAKFTTLLRRLLRHPALLGTPPQTWTYADAVSAVPLVSVSQWQSGARLLQRLWTASATHPPAHPAPAAPAAATSATLYTGPEQWQAVTCADSDDSRNPADYYTEARLAYARSGAFGLEWAWRDEVCADWPAIAGQDRYPGPWNRRTATSILVVGNTGDPDTPYQDSVAMSRALSRARLLTVHGYGHTELGNPSTCATSDEVRYLLSGALPPPGTICQQDTPPFPAPKR